MTKMTYEAPSFEEVGAFEALTQGGTKGSQFDGNFADGQPVPFDPNGQPLIFS